MGTEKRERQKANRQAKAEAQQAIEARQRRIKAIRNAVLVLVFIAVVLFWLSGCSSTASKASTTTTTAAANTTTTSPKAAKATFGTGACPPESGSPKPVLTFTAAPKDCLTKGKTYTATFVTTEGTFAVQLDTTRTPVTANNFIALARYRYYDATKIFRTESQSGIIQGGSPQTQDNSDPGPGYTIPDEGIPYPASAYGPGTLAMARTQAPNSAGGQFFLLANENGKYLGDPSQPGAGSYVPFGKVTSGLPVLVKISALDDGTGSGTPSKPVSITKVTISEA